MKTGPRRSTNSPLRWSKTKDPVRSAGSMSGVNWARVNVSPRVRARDRAASVAESRHVLQQDVAAGKHRGQHQREWAAFADDCSLHLVEHLLTPS